MSNREKGRGQPCQRGTLLPARPDDEGIGIVEILVAFVVFMICFIPLLKMIPTGAGIIAQSADQRLAVAVVNSALQNAQQSKAPPACPTPPTSCPSTPTSWSSASPSWGSAPRTATSQGGVNFQIWTAAGWCASDTPPGDAPAPTGMLSSQVPSYHIVVKVGWGLNPTSSSTSQVVVDSTEMSTVTGAPIAGQAVIACPLGLT